jgi:PKD repeat protein
MRAFRSIGLTIAVALGACLGHVGAAVAVSPVASFSVSPSLPRTMEVVTFQSTSTGDVTTTKWDLDNDGACDDASGSTARRSFAVSGTYRITLCLAGPDGSAEQSKAVRVANRGPTASLGQLPVRPETGDTVTFVSTSKDPDGPITSQAWDLDGDGSFDDGGDVLASRRYAIPGAYKVGLRVTDSNGAQATTTRTVAVRASLLSPFPVVRVAGSRRGSAVQIRLLEVDVPRGARVRIRCRGRGCPKARRHAQAARLRRFRRYERGYGPGAVLAVSVKTPGTIGKYTRFRVSRGGRLLRRDLCVAPGKRPTRCRSG